MSMVVKSNEELAIVKLRCDIIKQMEECIKNNEAQKVCLYTSTLSMLPVYLDYEEEEIKEVK